MDSIVFDVWRMIFIFGAVGSCISFFIGNRKRFSIIRAISFFLTGFLPYKAYVWLVENHWFGPVGSSVIAFIILVNVFFFCALFLDAIFESFFGVEKQGN